MFICGIEPFVYIKFIYRLKTRFVFGERDIYLNGKDKIF